MMKGRKWNEESLSENPAVAHLERLGWTCVPTEVLDQQRESLKQVVLGPRLAAAIKKLNPWISDDNVHKAVRAITGLQVTNLIEASEKLHTTLTYGIALEQDLGDGKKSHPVRYFDFETTATNEFVVTRQFKVHGAKKNIHTDVMLFVNGIPMGIIECKSPTLGEGWKHEAVDQFSRYQEIGDLERELGRKGKCARDPLRRHARSGNVSRPRTQLHRLRTR
jgi:type I restriction enzyme, R subunit